MTRNLKKLVFITNQNHFRNPNIHTNYRNLLFIIFENQRIWYSLKKRKNMSSTAHHDERMAKMTFASVYPHYVAKVEKKNRTKEELHQVIEWLTGYNEKTLQKTIENKISFEQFFKEAQLNPNTHLITV
jgi:hypothetical protein